MSTNSFIHLPIIYNENSAEEVFPFLIKSFNPQSVIDIGCGLGTWLSVVRKLGVTDIIGVDGAYVDTTTLHIPIENFIKKDLTKPFDLDRKFDMAICLEVAEHIDEYAADDFVKSLTHHADIILFSAAVPYQGGQRHVNEQWPDYWQKKFITHGFLFYDIMRMPFWDNMNVDPWYKQNMFIVANKQANLQYEVCHKIVNHIHPDIFVANSKYFKGCLNGETKIAFSQILKIIKKRLF